MFSNAYAVDGLCHNANRGSFNHECGRPAVTLGVNRLGFAMGFCAHCRDHGDEARDVVAWHPLPGTGARDV